MLQTQAGNWWRGQVRLPLPLVDWLKTNALNNYRSMNAELVDLIANAKRDQEMKNAPTDANG